MPNNLVIACSCLNLKIPVELITLLPQHKIIPHFPQLIKFKTVGGNNTILLSSVKF